MKCARIEFRMVEATRSGLVRSKKPPKTTATPASNRAECQPSRWFVRLHDGPRPAASQGVADIGKFDDCYAPESAIRKRRARWPPFTPKQTMLRSRRYVSFVPDMSSKR